MSCPDFVISDRGRASIGVGQGIPAGDYPLVSPSADIAGLIADMHLAYDDLNIYAGDLPHKDPLRIKYLAGIGCLGPMTGVPNGSHTADIRIVDTNDKIVFDSFAAPSVAYTKTVWSADYDIHEWRGEFAVCRIVVYKTWPKTDINDTDSTTARNYASKIAPAAAVINARAVYKMPKRLLSMRVRTAGLLTEKAKGEIVFKNGYNTELTVTGPTTENLRTTTRIAIAGVAGTGLGRFFNCADTNNDPVITTINGVAPADSGDFVMGGKDCLWTTHPVVAATNEETGATTLTRDASAGIKFGADCKACCSCEDYAGTAEYMNQVAYRYQLIGQRAQEVYTQHETNVANWEDTSCGSGEVMRMVATSQECGSIDVAITLCNTCDTCIPASSLTLDMYVPEPLDRRVPVNPDKVFVRHQQSNNVNGNRIYHGTDCSYTKISGAPIDTAIRVSGSYESQFSADDEIIDAAGNPIFTDVEEVASIPQIKPKSFIWPTAVPNVFTANTPTTEFMFDPGATDADCPDYSTVWRTNRNNPFWNWRATREFSNDDPEQGLYVYGIRLEDNDPIPTIAGIDIIGYLRTKYSFNITDSVINWDSIGVANVIDNTVAEPNQHERWWSPIGGVAYGDEHVNGISEVRTYEMINEGGIGAIISTPAAITALAARLNIANPDAANSVFIGMLAGDFASDVLPTVGMSIVDKFGLFSSWSPAGSGINGFWPAPIESVYVEAGDSFRIVWLRIKKPQAPDAEFPELNINFTFVGQGAGAIPVKTAAAEAFKTARFYNMNVFSDHVKLDGDGGFVAPWIINNAEAFNSIGVAAQTVDVNDARYSKPDRYIRAKTPRRITVSTPAVPPGSTIQIDFRITLRELDFLAYAEARINQGWQLCDDNALPLKFCSGTELSSGGLPLYDGADRVNIAVGEWYTGPGDDGLFYTLALSRGGDTIQHPDGQKICQTVGLSPPPCWNMYVPKYWRLLRWTKTLDTIVDNPLDVLTDDEYLAQYGCPTEKDDAVFNAVVTKTTLTQEDPAVPAKTRVKVCGFKYADNGKRMTKRKVTPRGPYSISLVLTGKKPTGSTADLTKQHILDKACESTRDAKKAFIAEVVQLKCDLDGQTPGC